MIASPLWLIATLAAALFQSWRTAVQKRVSQQMSLNAAGLVRYLYGLPFALAMCGVYLLAKGDGVPAMGPLVLPMCIAAGLAQIIATNLLLLAFGYRNFVVGTAYAKTEAVQGALLSMLLLGEWLSLLSWIGIAVGVAGVMTLSLKGQDRDTGFVRALTQPAALCGVASGFFFALTAIAVRRATADVATDDPIQAALLVLALTVALQTLMQGSYVAWRERAQLRAVAASWRVSGQVGLLSALGSACWFSAFAMAPVALVRVVGQAEVLFTLLFARFYLHEPLRRSEVAGLALVATGVALALLGTR